MPTIVPSRGTHMIDRRTPTCRSHAGAIVPAGEGRSIFALPWLGRSLIGTTDNNYEGDIDHVRPSGEDIDYLLEATNEFFGTDLGVGDLRRRLRRRAAADLERRHAQVGRHLAQGRAVRDLERADHDHRRQAHDLAADGEAGRRPARRARRAPGAVPDARDPARPADRPPMQLPRVEGVPEDVLRARSPAATATPPSGVLRTAARARRARAADRCRAPRPARRGAVRGPQRAGADRRRRASAAYPARAAGRPRALRAGQRGAAAGGASDRRRARLGSSGGSSRRSSASATRRGPRGSRSDLRRRSRSVSAPRDAARRRSASSSSAGGRG